MADTGVQQALQSRAEHLGAMSFLEHLEELRKRIILALLGLVVGFGVCYAFHNQIYAFMQKPITAVFTKYGFDSKLTYLNPIEPFNMYLKMGLIGGIFLASPWILYQLWCFISPGLYRHEKRYVVPFMVCTILLFLAGGWFGYRLVYPMTLDFLIEYGKQFKPNVTISEYTDLFLTIIVGLGVIFEMPILVFFLSLMGLVSAGWMWRNFRYGILGIFVVAAIVAPTPDIMTMCIFASPMVALYLLSIGVAWLVHPKQRKARAEARAKNA